MTAMILVSLPPEAFTKLTPREFAVVRLRAQGHTLDSVAQELGISYSTAKNHVASILRTLQISSIAEVCYFLGRMDERTELLTEIEQTRTPSPCQIESNVGRSAR